MGQCIITNRGELYAETVDGVGIDSNNNIPLDAFRYLGEATGDIDDFKGLSNVGYWSATSSLTGNKPSSYGILLVFRRYASGFTQMWITYSGSVIYTRTWNGSVWSDWVTYTTGVKGNAETDYRTGNVNLTPANIGAQPTLTAGDGIKINGNTISNVFTRLASPDLDDIRYNFQGYVTTCTNKPSSANATGELIVISRDDNTNYCMQLYSGYNSNDLWVRNYNNGAWSSWARVVYSDQLGLQVLSQQSINFATSSTVGAGETTSVTVSFTSVTDATQYWTFPIGCTYGAIENVSRQGTTNNILVTIRNLSGAAHTLSGRIVVVALK